MKKTKIPGIFLNKNKLYTENLSSSKGKKIYNEQLKNINGIEYRSWNPYRSKLAAAVKLGLNDLNLTSESNVLYLGAATGTTVSHISDIVKNGIIYAIEYSPIATKKLLKVCKVRPNIIPIIEDAYHPDRYSPLVSQVDFIYQDISQRNQAEIFIKNVKRYLIKPGHGILMIKARSIDVSLKPKLVYEQVAKQLKENQIKVQNIIDLSPYEKDHAAMIITI